MIHSLGPSSALLPFAMGISTSGKLLNRLNKIDVVNNKTDRLMYNLSQSVSAAITFALGCKMTHPTRILDDSWQNIVFYSIIASPLLTRTISYLCGKNYSANADRVDLYLGKLWNQVHIIGSLAIMILLRSQLSTGQLIAGALMLSLNSGLLKVSFSSSTEDSLIRVNV